MPLDTIEAIDIRYVKRIYGDRCGPFGTQLLYLRNIHPSLSIRASIDLHWVYQNEQQHKYFDVVLEPNYAAGPEPTSLDVEMGCPIPLANGQEFVWDVKAAVFV